MNALKWAVDLSTKPVQRYIYTCGKRISSLQFVITITLVLFAFICTALLRAQYFTEASSGTFALFQFQVSLPSPPWFLLVRSLQPLSFPFVYSVCSQGVYCNRLYLSTPTDSIVQLDNAHMFPHPNVPARIKNITVNDAPKLRFIKNFAGLLNFMVIVLAPLYCIQFHRWLWNDLSAFDLDASYAKDLDIFLCGKPTAEWRSLAKSIVLPFEASYCGLPGISMPSHKIAMKFYSLLLQFPTFLREQSIPVQQKDFPSFHQIIKLQQDISLYTNTRVYINLCRYICGFIFIKWKLILFVVDNVLYNYVATVALCLCSYTDVKAPNSTYIHNNVSMNIYAYMYIS